MLGKEADPVTDLHFPRVRHAVLEDGTGEGITHIDDERGIERAVATKDRDRGPDPEAALTAGIEDNEPDRAVDADDAGFGKIGGIGSRLGRLGESGIGGGEGGLGLGPHRGWKGGRCLEHLQERLTEPMDRGSLTLDFLLGDVEVADGFEKALLEGIGITGDQVDSEGLELQLGLAGGRHLLLADAHGFGKTPDEGLTLGLGILGPFPLGVRLIPGNLQGGAQFADLDGFSSRFLGAHPHSPTQAQHRPRHRESGAKEIGMDGEYHVDEQEENRGKQRRNTISP